MSEFTKHTRGVAFVCDFQGILVEVVNDEVGILREIDKGQPVTTMFDEQSLQKGLKMVDTIRENGTAYKWEIYIQQDDEIELLYFSGIRNGQKLLLIGASSHDQAVGYYNELMKINNEHVNELRSLLKANNLMQQNGEKLDLYEQMSQLNNELTSAQRKLAKKTAELERSNELKNRMLGMAAHDLRSPLNVIQSFSTMLLEDHKEKRCFTKEQFEFIKEINNSSESMVRIIEDMLDISAIESGNVDLHITECDLVELINRMVHLHKFEARKKEIMLKTDLPDAPILKEIDPHKFEQVLNNLISNAIKYSQPGTTTTVGINRDSGKEKLSIYVKDQGQGIPEDKLDQLFQPFADIGVETTAGEKSTGLGLSITKRIIEAHDGKISVESEVGEGSTFFVELP